MCTEAAARRNKEREKTKENTALKIDQGRYNIVFLFNALWMTRVFFPFSFFLHLSFYPRLTFNRFSFVKDGCKCYGLNYNLFGNGFSLMFWKFKFRPQHRHTKPKALHASPLNFIRMLVFHIRETYSHGFLFIQQF